jgi:hypothetical protein
MFRPSKNIFSKTTRILHITDSEGTNSLLDAARRSTFVGINSDNGLFFRKTLQTPYFIYGGDATDRGPHDLATVEMLTDFKKRHPNNVALLVGNRDIKNNRFKIELDPTTIRDRLLSTEAPRWLSEVQQTTPLAYLLQYMRSHHFDVEDNMKVIQYARAIPIELCQLIYLNWMLEKTMGCPFTFNYRRDELKRQTSCDFISDEKVLQSFIDETLPTGLMGEYLKLGQMAVVVPGTRVLAVHGGITYSNIGRIPGSPSTAIPFANARKWVEVLNNWYAEQIRLWSCAGGNKSLQPANTALDDAVLPLPGKYKHVVTADMLSSDRHFTSVPAAVCEYLHNAQISVVLTGHQPCGDHPALIRGENGILSINADTGYADYNPDNPHDTRGKASHIMEIQSDADKVTVEIAATLSDGISVRSNLIINANRILQEPFQGKLLQDGRLVQCRLPDGDYRLAKQKNFDVKYSTISALELAQKFDNEKLPELQNAVGGCRL